MKTGGQPDRMGVTATPKYNLVDAQGMERIWGSCQKCFDRHAFYVDNNVTNVSYSAIKAAYGVFPPEKILPITVPITPENSPLQTTLESINI